MGVVVCIFIATSSYSQVCDGPLTVTIEGSTSGETLDVSCDAIQPLCNTDSGALSGEVSVSTLDANGDPTGSPDYTYLWSTSDVTDTVTGLGTGTYSVTVTDANNCTDECSVMLTEPTPVTVTGVEVGPSCFSADGTNNGTITITPGGGSTPYTYEWTGPDVNVAAQDQTGLGVGTYTVVVTDATGLCTASETFMLSEPQQMDIAETVVDPSCFSADGINNGSITIVPSGGTAPYTYAWTGPDVNASAQDQTGLGAGTYTVVVTDATGLCTYEETYTLNEPQQMDITEMLGAPTCNSDDGNLTGTIDIVPSGGTAPYTYAWTGTGTDATAQNQSGLGEGSYTVVVTDATGLCTYEETYSLTEPQPIVITPTPTEPPCNASNTPAVMGAIDLAVTGGTAPYTYAWTGPGTTSSATAQNQSGLGTGSYTVVVTDANDCTETITVDLTEPPAIDIIAALGNLDCHFDSYDAPEGPDGTISLISAGGTGTLTYAWTGPAGATNLDPSAQNQTDLIAGSYTVLVTDENGCTFTDTYELTQPDPVEVVGTVTPLLCNAASGAPSGAINITASGGVGTEALDYTYAWTNVPAGQENLENQENLPAGTYTVEVTDPNGCVASESWTLGEPEEVTCSLDATDILCNGDLSTITVTPGGGAGAGVTGDYTYTLTGTTAGTTIDPNTGDPISSGVVGPTVQVGVPTFNNIEAGTYTVEVEDENGCTSTCMITIDQPTLAVAGTCVVQDECQLDAGQIEVCAEEGVGPYTITWSSSTGGTLIPPGGSAATSGTVTDVVDCVTFSGAQGGETYTFVVTDANGCIAVSIP